MIHHLQLRHFGKKKYFCTVLTYTGLYCEFILIDLNLMPHPPCSIYKSMKASIWQLFPETSQQCLMLEQCLQIDTTFVWKNNTYLECNLYSSYYESVNLTIVSWNKPTMFNVRTMLTNWHFICLKKYIPWVQLVHFLYRPKNTEG